MGANFEGARKQVQVQDDGDGRDAQRQFRATARRLFLIIPKSMKETALCEQFEKFGPLEYISVVKDKVEGCNLSYKPKFADPRPSLDGQYRDT